MKKMFSIVFIIDCNGRKDADSVMDTTLDFLEEKFRDRNFEITNRRIKDIFKR